MGAALHTGVREALAPMCPCRWSVMACRRDGVSRLGVAGSYCWGDPEERKLEGLWGKRAARGQACRVRCAAFRLRVSRSRFRAHVALTVIAQHEFEENGHSPRSEN